MLTDFQYRMNVDAEYQRGKVWSQPQQALLIDSILRGFAIPTLFLRKLPDGSQHLFDVVDGKQRLTAIWRFLADDIRLLRSAEPFPQFGDLSGKCWSEFSTKAQDSLQFSSITVAKIEEANDEQIRELFLRLQKGEPLHAAEKRNAMTGPVRDFVAEELARHRLWETTGISPRRFGRDEHAAILLALVAHDGPTGIKGADLQKLYEADDFELEGPTVDHTRDLLDILYEISKRQMGLIRTRWGLVDLALVLIRSRREGVDVEPEQVAQFYEQFERARRHASVTWSDFQSKVVEASTSDTPPHDIWEQLQIPQDILNYHLAFAREGGSVENIEIRYKTMYKRFLEFVRPS